jgi:CTP synthase
VPYLRDSLIVERHRCQFNHDYEAVRTGEGLRITGTTPTPTYVEIVEIPTHPSSSAASSTPNSSPSP